MRLCGPILIPRSMAMYTGIDSWLLLPADRFEVLSKYLTRKLTAEKFTDTKLFPKPYAVWRRWLPAHSRVGDSRSRMRARRRQSPPSRPKECQIHRQSAVEDPTRQPHSPSWPSMWGSWLRHRTRSVRRSGPGAERIGALHPKSNGS